MHPFEKQSSDLPESVSPHLDVRLKPGWRFDRRRRALVADARDAVSLRELLPAGAKIVPMVAALSNKKRRNMTEDERILGRYLQVLLPSIDDSADVAATLRDLDGVELVSIPPRVGLT